MPNCTCGANLFSAVPAHLDACPEADVEIVMSILKIRERRFVVDEASYGQRTKRRRPMTKDPDRVRRRNPMRDDAEAEFDRRWRELFGDVEPTLHYMEMQQMLDALQAAQPELCDENRRRELLALARFMESVPGGTRRGTARVVHRTRPI
jgi:hypothetical protein